jgi:GMP synthase (glutamine-hydrolysing)
MSSPVLVVLHHPATDTALIEEVLVEQGRSPRIVRFFAGATNVDLGDIAGLVVLGGAMGAYESAQYPFLEDTMRLLDRAIERDVPTLAICLGAQLLARVAGGRAFPGHAGREWGFVPITLTAAGRVDAVLADMEGEHFSFHADSFELPTGVDLLAPTGVDLLARSPTYPQAFRVGSALGLQFHPELSLAGIHHLLTLLGPDASEAAIRRARATAADRQAATHRTLATLLATSIPGPAPTPSSWRSGCQHRSPSDTGSGAPSSRRRPTG